MKTYCIKPRIDYTAHEITREDFHPGSLGIPGVVYRRETLTVRLAAPDEIENNTTDSCESRSKNRIREGYEAREKGVAPAGKHSFYGIGCAIICQNGKPIDIVGPDKLGELYHLL